MRYRHWRKLELGSEAGCFRRWRWFFWGKEACGNWFWLRKKRCSRKHSRPDTVCLCWVCSKELGQRGPELGKIAVEKCSALLVFVRARILGHWTVLSGGCCFTLSLSYLSVVQTQGEPPGLLQATKNVKGVRSLWGPQAWVSLLSYLGGTGYHWGSKNSLPQVVGKTRSTTEGSPGKPF